MSERLPWATNVALVENTALANCGGRKGGREGEWEGGRERWREGGRDRGVS